MVLSILYLYEIFTHMRRTPVLTRALKHKHIINEGNINKIRVSYSPDHTQEENEKESKMNKLIHCLQLKLFKVNILWGL